ncbi:hypothetical protein O181_076874 [Austropuccinia psidii MF-1]|uniref:Uncharacterized protein n=1 Tax=Austropuccinia psidii MF-1 TaxID=1389203 RepID=A0A9Q3IFU1_9BASI|nr:hypothetical protein [Austropuccinia psidii MF-1]
MEISKSRHFPTAQKLVKMQAVDNALRIIKLPKVPQETNFPKAPIGLPLDFYNKKWLRSLPVSQQRIVVDKNSVAFLPDPSRSLLPPQNKDHDCWEKWSDRRFSKEFAETTLKSYGLDEEEGDSEGDNVDEQDEEDVEGGVIDLAVPSDGDKDLEYVKDGEWSRLYDEDYVQSSEGQSETEEDKEEFADEMGKEERREE